MTAARHPRTILRVFLGTSLGLAALTALPSRAQAQARDEAIANLTQSLDLVWMLVAAGLVLLMQAGFLLLEAGMVRSKNSINVAQKNMLDMAFSAVAFALFGFMFAFGTAGHGLPFGTSGNYFVLSELTPWELGFFVFQVMFCATAATIVSGAVAERMRLSAYILSAIFIALVIYPLFVHWSWGNALSDNATAFLANAGFVDFAGSTVVHATGAWVALAACMVLGPRLGRFAADDRAIRIAGHNPILTAAGALLLFVGWIGFNGGSTTSASPSTAGIITNTVLAGGTGAIAGFLIGWSNDGVILPEKTISGMIGGLVAITAGCAVLTVPGALVIGFAGGAIAVLGNQLLETRFKIDDAVGAIGVHGFAGVIGTVGLVFLAPLAALPTGSRMAQLEIQTIAVVLNFVWAFCGGYLFFFALDRLRPIRVSAEQEELGLNQTEHGTRLGIGHVEKALGALAAGHADLAMRLKPEPGDESETLSRLFNCLMDRIEAEEIERRRSVAEQRDGEEAERLSALADATFEAIWILRDGLIIDGNAKLEELVGAPLSRIRGMAALDLIAPRSRPRVIDAMGHDVVEPYEADIQTLSGEAIPVQLRGRAISYHGGPARVGCLVDLRERKKSEARIRHLALHDPLTGLPNRLLFGDKLEAMVARQINRGRAGAVLLIDLDRFKDINDVHGHPAGDRVIKAAAERMSGLVGPIGTVARLGGDEFGIVLSDLTFLNHASDLAYRLIKDLARPFDIGFDKSVNCGASVGIALCPRDGDTADKLVSRADTALYQAKHSGRNTYRVFEEGMDAAFEKRRALEADMDRALTENEFVLFFQPRVSLDHASAPAYEALVRWQHGERGLISPADFIPVAETSGKIVALGEWVLRTACEASIAILKGSRVSINVSPIQLKQANFVERVQAILAETGAEAKNIEIEITEGVLIDDDKNALAVLSRLKALGIAIALDDFGTGYASLGYLSRFPFDTIKIDRSFISGMQHSAHSRAIVQTIVELGRSLGINLVAEGVETPGEALALAAIGCRELQGYLFGRPAPLDELQPIDARALDAIASAGANRLRSAGAPAETTAGMLSVA